MSTIQPWIQISARPAGDFRIFRIQNVTRKSPRTGSTHDFFVIDCANWVNVIAVTPDDQIVMIEQYRHGSNTVELEIPGGIIDPHETSPISAGVRELREETGYEGEDAVLIGQIFPNPAIMSNTCFTLLVRNCVLRHPTALDHGEDIVTKLVPMSTIPNLIANRQIQHSLVVVALYHFELWKRTKSPGSSEALHAPAP